MVKRATHSLQIPGVSLQEFCDLFAQKELFIDFHIWNHRNERVSCGDWSVCADGSWQRDVSFLMPLEAPAWLKKAVGKPQELLGSVKACQRDDTGAHTSRGMRLGGVSHKFPDSKSACQAPRWSLCGTTTMCASA